MEHDKIIEGFSNTMKIKLDVNGYKSHWSEKKNSYLLERLKEEVKDLENALINNEPILGECADIANFAMMIADKEGLIDTP